MATRYRTRIGLNQRGLSNNMDKDVQSYPLNHRTFRNQPLFLPSVYESFFISVMFPHHIWVNNYLLAPISSWTTINSRLLPLALVEFLWDTTKPNKTDVLVSRLNAKNI